MKVLHIINSYGGTEVYKNLITALDNLGVVQIVYAPLSYANRERVGSQMTDFKVEGSKIIYSTILNRLDRFMYAQKIRKCTKDIEKNIALNDVDIIHGGMAMYDGAIAYKLSCKHNIPYISAIRGTDNVYYNKFVLYRPFFKKVLLNASKLMSISPHCLKDFTNKPSLKSIRDAICLNTQIIPNGVDKSYLQNLRHRSPASLNKSIKIVYVGAYQEAKGVREMILATKELNEKGYSIEFDAIGEGLPFRATSKEYIASLKKTSESCPKVRLLHFMDRIHLLEALQRYDVFAMPSKNETFGLVYIEALTQGIPYLYSKNDGIDGFYEDGSVCFGAKALDVEDIKKAIVNIHDNYPRLIENINSLNLKDQFGWKFIALKYYEIYKSVLNHD